MKDVVCYLWQHMHAHTQTKRKPVFVVLLCFCKILVIVFEPKPLAALISSVNIKEFLCQEDALSTQEKD
jgi:hypothetical protein